MNMRIFCFSVLFFFITFNDFSQEGKLDKAKSSLKKNTSSSFSSSATKKSKSNSTCDLNNDDVGFENLIFKMVWYAAAYTFYGVFIESPWEMNGRMSSAEFSNYPYKDAKYGNFIYTDSTNYNITRFDLSNHFLIESNNLYGNSFEVDFKFLKRFSLNLNHTTFQENVNGKRDSFNMFSTLLKYHRIRTQRFNLWFGLGFRHVFNDVNKTGLLMGFGSEIFIKKPISIAMSHNWATIGNQSVKNTRLLLKYNIKNYRIASGYQHYKLGVSKIKAFSIGVEASF